MKKKRALVAIPGVVLVGVVAVVLVAGARSATTGSLDDQSSGGSSVAQDAKGEPATDGNQTSGTTQAVAVQPLSRAVISTGQISLTTKEMAKSRAEVLRLVSSWGGTVADEQSGTDGRGRLANTTMTLRVPTARFSDALSQLSGLGKVVEESRKSEDVTTQVIDNDARVRAAERSIRQIESLLPRATRMGDIIAIESDLARRQADLDSLKSQQAWLEDQTSLSTINVYLSKSSKATSRGHEARGFLAGLDGGWTALTAATVLVLTAVGAMIPFSLPVLLLGVPLWLFVRRHWSRLSAPSAPAQSA
jgi:hypothetical protein